MFKLVGKLFIVTVVPFSVLAVVLVPEPLITIPPASAILITTPLSNCVFGKDTSFANILNASRDIKLWMDEFKVLYNKAGFFSPKELDNYFPRVLNWEAINANRPAAEKIFTEIFKKNYKLTQEKAEAAAKTYLSKNEGKPSID